MRWLVNCPKPWSRDDEGFLACGRGLGILLIESQTFGDLVYLSLVLTSRGIVSLLCRTDPLQVRRLLYNLKLGDEDTTLSTERRLRRNE